MSTKRKYEFSIEQERKFLAMRKAGMSMPSIGAKVGVSGPTMANLMKRFEKDVKDYDCNTRNDQNI